MGSYDLLFGNHNMLITSLKNPRVKAVVRLRQRRGRDQAEKVLIEGYRPLLRAVQSQYPLEEIFICRELFQGENEDALLDSLRQRGCMVIETTEPVFRKMAYRDRPEGLLGVGPQIRRGLQDMVLPTDSPPLLLIAEGIEKPGNLGTMLRSADATGVSGVILCDSCTDLFNPNVVRASIGSLFTVPLAEADSEETLQWLAEQQIAVAAATPHTQCRFTEADFTRPLAIVVGREQVGLTQPWIDRCNTRVRIPMLGVADSLNVATATALLLYEAVRQRLQKGIIADTGAIPED